MSTTINSLKKGNLQSVTFVVGGEERKQYVEANPQFKTVKVYDSSLQRINDRESKSEKQSQSKEKSAAQNNNDDEPAQKESNSASRSRKTGRSV